MIKKAVFLFAIGSFVVATSCKKQEEVAVETVTPTDQTVATEVPMPETATPPADGKFPVMEFEKKEHDFGTINQGDKVVYTFNFKNTGEADLIISNAVGSCGCTVPEYPKEAVKPGESGKMKVSFDSAGKSGQQQKTITVTANTAAGKETLTIKTSITPKTGSAQ